jgi:hypothetical protein
MRPARREITILTVAAALAAAAMVSAPPRAGAAAPRDPPANLPIGPMPSVCAAAGTGRACEDAAVSALDHARGTIGLGSYRLPAGFEKMPASHQWLILANQDRAAYSLPRIAGIATALNRVAHQGAIARRDPDPLPLLMTLHGQRTFGFASNWAGGQLNALVAYYGWMYDDGYGSGNVDCGTPSAPGCWGHRHNVLAFPHATALTLGTAALTARASYALTIVETSTPPWPFAYRARG